MSALLESLLAGTGKAIDTADNFLQKPGGSMLLNLLAQQGYSTMPQSPMAAIGRAGLATQQQQRQSGLDDLNRRLTEARIDSLNTAASNPTAGNIARTFEGANGNMWVFTRGSTEPIDTGVQFNERVRFIERSDGSVVALDASSGEEVGMPVTPEEARRVSDRVSEVETDRALTTGEAGRGRVRTDDGFEAVPGTQAAIQEEEAARKRIGGAFMKSIQSQTVVEDVSRLNKQLDADTVPFGRKAALQEGLTPMLQSEGYRNANSLIESVKGNVGIDSLLRIKATGAGLGQVPQSQLDLLSRLLGELDLKQSKEQFSHTWNRMGEVYQSILEKSEDELIELGELSPNIFKPGADNDTGPPEGVTQEQWDVMTPEHRSLWPN